jgi:hypothetical protein
MQTELSEENKNKIPIKFHFYRLKFTPYTNAKNENSHTILHQVITFLSQEQQAGRGILIDKHEDRGKESARPLFVTQAVFMFKEKRIRLSMALLRTGRIPMLKPTDKFLLVPFDTSNGEIAEQTHFFIDYNTDSIVLCVEFNSNGPRLSDIEYYFRVVARDKLKLARATEIELYMDTSIDKTLADLKNVLNIDVKVQPQKLSQLDPVLVGQYFTGISNLGQHVRPKYVKLEVMFQTPGRQYVSSQLNKEGNSMFTRILNAFKTKPTNMDAFEHFVVRYEDKDGKEEVFNLLKGKKEIVKLIDGKITKTRQWYELIETDFDEFIQTLQ